MSLNEVKSAIGKIVDFLTPLLPLVNSHMVNFITKEQWNVLPSTLQEDLHNLPMEYLHYIPTATVDKLSDGNYKGLQCHNLATSHGSYEHIESTNLATSHCNYEHLESDNLATSIVQYNDFESCNLASFLTAVHGHCLENLNVLTLIEQVVGEHGDDVAVPLQMSNVMSQKKTHEVDTMSYVVAALSHGLSTTWVVDIGSGLGYLSSALSLQYKLNVLAIDASNSNIASAHRRNDRIEKHWTSLTHRCDGEDCTKGRIVKGKSKKLKRKNESKQRLLNAAMNDKESILNDTNPYELVRNSSNFKIDSERFCSEVREDGYVSSMDSQRCNLTDDFSDINLESLLEVNLQNEVDYSYIKDDGISSDGINDLQVKENCNFSLELDSSGKEIKGSDSNIFNSLLLKESCDNNGQKHLIRDTKVVKTFNSTQEDIEEFNATNNDMSLIAQSEIHNINNNNNNNNDNHNEFVYSMYENIEYSPNKMNSRVYSSNHIEDINSGVDDKCINVVTSDNDDTYKIQTSYKIITDKSTNDKLESNFSKSTSINCTEENIVNDCITSAVDRSKEIIVNISQNSSLIDCSNTNVNNCNSFPCNLNLKSSTNCDQSLQEFDSCSDINSKLNQNIDIWSTVDDCCNNEVITQNCDGTINKSSSFNNKIISNENNSEKLERTNPSDINTNKSMVLNKLIINNENNSEQLENENVTDININNKVLSFNNKIISDLCNSEKLINEDTTQNGKYIGITKFVDTDENLLTLILTSINSEPNELNYSTYNSNCVCLRENGPIKQMDIQEKKNINLDLGAENRDSKLAEIVSMDSSDKMLSKSENINNNNKLLINNKSQVINSNLFDNLEYDKSQEMFGEHEINNKKISSKNKIISIDSKNISSKEELSNDPRSFGLVGLHTCGNLSATCLRLFLSNPSAKFLVNVGCCLHLLEEEFKEIQSPLIAEIKKSTSEFNKNNILKNSSNTKQLIDENPTPKPLEDFMTDSYHNEFKDLKIDDRYDSVDNDPLHLSIKRRKVNGFPLSAFLREKEFKIGRNALMLSMQSSHRLGETDQSNRQVLFWRALLQQLLEDKLGKVPENYKVGKLKDCRTFREYTERAMKKLDLPISITLEEIHKYESMYKHSEDLLDRFFLIKASLAPVIEGLLLLDRLAFLLSEKTLKSHLVQLFDPIQSPRCYGVISIRS